MIAEEKQVEIEYGDLEGQYFTQWRVEDLKIIANEILRRNPTAINFKIWYDPIHDYHRLSLEVHGKKVRVTYYKVYRLEINLLDDSSEVPDSWDWEFKFRFMRSNSWDIPRYIGQNTEPKEK